MSTLSLPSGSYRSPAATAFNIRLQRTAVRFLQGVGAAGVTLWNRITEEPGAYPAEPTNAQELLEHAFRLEATQPSYAADLRAVALRHME
jgi:hypothetical protein